MSINITIHNITHVRVRNCTDFVTVEFSTPTGASASLFFPDHAAVQAMIAELMMTEHQALEEWRTEVLARLDLLD